MPCRVETYSQADEAARALAANQAARYFGGGTIVMCAVNAGSQSFDTLIRITDPALRAISAQGERIMIGAAATMADILDNRDLEFLHPVARLIGGPAIRNAATVGGNLHAAAPYGDLATALLALGGEIQFAGNGQASMSIDEFLRQRHNHRSRIVTGVAVRRPAEPGAFRFRKVSRVHPKGVAVMAMAALLPRGRSGVRVAYGNMATAPTRVAAVERALEGAGIDEAGIAPALAVATDGLDVPSDALASQWYRREVAPVQLKRLLLGDAG